MQVFRLFSKLRIFLDARPSIYVGFVPTMGALHQGHLSLINQSKAQCGITVCSIFVNPTQFNSPEDLEKYPRTEKTDLEKLRSIRCDVAFVPNVDEVYPRGTALEKIDLNGLDKVMEGKHRPGHFDGVVQVVWRFFEQIQPNKAFFGEKDFQQLAIIRQLVQVKKLDIDIVGCPILREPSGLAMSSRNVRLSDEGRKTAGFIFRQLQNAREWFPKYGVDEIRIRVDTAFRQHPDFELEYFEIADSSSLQPITNKSSPARAFIAAYLEGIRLIDNIALNY